MISAPTCSPMSSTIGSLCTRSESVWAMNDCSPFWLCRMVVWGPAGEAEPSPRYRASGRGRAIAPTIPLFRIEAVVGRSQIGELVQEWAAIIGGCHTVGDFGGGCIRLEFGIDQWVSDACYRT